MVYEVQVIKIYGLLLNNLDKKFADYISMETQLHTQCPGDI